MRLRAAVTAGGVTPRSSARRALIGVCSSCTSSQIAFSIIFLGYTGFLAPQNSSRNFKNQSLNGTDFRSALRCAQDKPASRRLFCFLKCLISKPAGGTPFVCTQPSPSFVRVNRRYEDAPSDRCSRFAACSVCDWRKRAAKSLTRAWISSQVRRWISTASPNGSCTCQSSNGWPAKRETAGDS